METEILFECVAQKDCPKGMPLAKLTAGLPKPQRTDIIFQITLIVLYS